MFLYNAYLIGVAVAFVLIPFVYRKGRLKTTEDLFLAMFLMPIGSWFVVLAYLKVIFDDIKEALGFKPKRQW